MLFWPFYAIVFKPKIRYEDKADFKAHRRAGAVLITNHYNMFDFILNIYLCLPRKLYIVASELAFQNKLITFGMKFFGGIQANRNTHSLRFIDESVRLLQQGKLVQIFPEGRNTDDGEIQPFHPTYLLMALRADAVIIPVVTDGHYGLLRRAHLYVGRTIRLSECGLTNPASKEQLAAVNDRIRDRIVAMRRALGD